MTRARTLADMISDGVIGTTELADDAITPVKLDETGNYTIAQLTVSGEAALNGNVSATGSFAIKLDSNDDQGNRNFSVRNHDGSQDFFTIYESGDAYLYDNSGNAKFFWDASAEVLGIGTASPNTNSQLNVVSASGEGSIRIDGGTNTKLTSIASNTGSNILYFGDTDSFQAGMFRYQHSDDLMTLKSTDAINFVTANIERLFIDNSGNLLVGTASTQPAVDNDASGISLQNVGTIHTSGNYANSFNRTASDGDIVQYRKAGGIVGRIGIKNTTSGFYIKSDKSDLILETTGGYLYLDANDFSPSTTYNGTHDLGRSNARFKDLHLSGGIEIENGSGNVGVGRQALNFNTGDGNTALGLQASYSLTSGTDQVSVGARSGYSNQTSNDNTFIGNQAGYATTGGGNTFVGVTRGGGSYGAGRYVTSGSKNTILGAFDGNQDGLDIRTSSNNIVLSDGDGNVGADRRGSDELWSGIGGSTTLCVLAYYNGTSWYPPYAFQNTGAGMLSSGSEVALSGFGIPNRFKEFKVVRLFYGAAGTGGQQTFNFTVRSVATNEGWTLGSNSSFTQGSVTGSNGKHYKVDIAVSTFSPASISGGDFLTCQITNTINTAGTTFGIKGLMLQWV